MPKSKPIALTVSVGLGVTGALVVLLLLGSRGASAAASGADTAALERHPMRETARVSSAPAAVHYVATTGEDTGDCTTPTSPCLTVQYAVDQATAGAEVRIAAGVYTDVHVRPSDDPSTTEDVTQVVYISKTITVRGGYTTTNWTTPDPDANRTTLDARQQGRALYTTGPISVAIGGLRMTGGYMLGYGSGLELGDCGGGVLVVTSTLVMSNSSVLSNTHGMAGGGLCLYYGNHTLISNAIAGNVAETYDGGGLFTYNSDFALLRNTFTLNSADKGGGLRAMYGNATIQDNSMVNNHATAEGGGIYREGGNTAIIRNTFVSNTAGGGAGAFLLWFNGPLDSNVFAGNTAADTAGAFLLLASSPRIVNNAIVNNSAGDIGAAIYASSSAAQFVHNTIANNTGCETGVYLAPEWGVDSDVTFTNTVIAGHTVGVHVSSGSTATLRSTLWHNEGADWDGEGTVFRTGDHTGDPLLAQDGYHLQCGSPAIDAGTDTKTPDDIDGDARPEGSGFDIGADEVMTSLMCRYLYLPLVVRSH